MKIKKILLLLVVLVLGLTVSSCSVLENLINSQGSNNDNSTTNNNDVNLGPTEIAASDLVRPNKTILDYTDYGTIGDGETMPDYDTSKWYRNDLKDVPLPDPHIYYEDGVYYIYGTTDRTGAQSLDCYTTTDFIDYELHMNILHPNSGYKSDWEANVLFAPEMYKFGDYYYLYYSNTMKGSGNRYLHVVKGESPLGPFEQINEVDANGKTVNGKSKPVFEFPEGHVNALDSTIFVDDDGRMYMYYVISTSTQHIIGAEMKDPITIDWSTRKALVVPGELQTNTNADTLFWEAYNGYNIAEAPYMIKSPNGLYYLTYSVNSYENRYYSICYAYSDSPLGDYEKPYTPEQKQNGEIWTNLLLGYSGGLAGSSVYDQWTGFSSGNGHHCFFNIGDQIMIAYHQHKNRNSSGLGRAFAMDYLYFDEDGVPYTDGPTWSLQARPEALSGYKNIALNATVRYLNVENAHFINDNYVVRHANLVQEANKEVIINGGKAYIELVFDKEYTIGGIQINNSAYYDKALYEIAYINFFNDNVIYNASFMPNYVNDEKEFIFPGSSFTIDFDDIKATKVILCFDTTDGAQINEIKVLGK